MERHAMNQGNLFQTNAYGDVTAAPASHAGDPQSSHDAAAKHTKSGKRQRNADLVLMLVRVQVLHLM
jgi:hypothetical protein